jgi:branched-chain amino acid transport system substrate-binding protein
MKLKMRRKIMKKKTLALGVSLLLISSMLLSVTGCGQKSATTTEKKENPIILGVATSLGQFDAAGSLKAAQLAVDEINASGGVDVGGTKRPFEIVSIDTRDAEPSIPVTDALAAIEKQILEKKPAAMVVGVLRSEVLLSAMDMIAKYKLPYMVSIAMTPDFEKKVESDAKYKYLFRVGLSSPYLVGNLSQTLASIGKSFNYDKIYFVNQDVAWAKGTNDALEKWAKGNGWNVVGHDAYPTGAADFSSTLNKAKLGGAQVIVPLFDMPESANLVKQANAMKVPALFAGFVSSAASESAWKTFNGDINGLVNFLFESASLPVKALPKTITFNEAFGKKYGEAERTKITGHGGGPSYDSIFILAEAIKKAGSLDADKIVTALEQTDMDGMIGHLKFNKNHQIIYGSDPKTTAISMAFQWIDGKRIAVYPEAVAEGKIVLPAAK